MDGNGTKGYRISSGTAELIGHLERTLSLDGEHDEAMKRAGITRAYVGQIGQDDVPYGKVRLFSEEWWHLP